MIRLYSLLRRALAACLATLHVSSVAFATDVEVCIRINTAWEDMTSGDIMTTDTSHPARAIMLLVDQISGPVRFFGFVDDEGCATVSLTLNTAHTISTYSTATVNGV